ncbi:MAG: ATP-dependent DNA helicase [Deltaproteobacteria bacterium]|nr:ATP-dependent DNA helicase [Deltaproteobacteria bacterium]
MESNFTPAQTGAIQADGSAAVIAGAGSGKTRVLIERIRHLLEKGVPLHRIAAFTFTEKAAGEIRERLVGSGVIRDEEEAEAAIGTLHSFFARLLRRLGPRLGLDPGFKILGESSQVLSLEERLDKYLNENFREKNPVLLKYAAIFGTARLKKIIRSLLAEPRFIHAGFKAPHAGKDLALEVGRFSDCWLREKVGCARLHYDDLEFLTLKLLRDFPEIASEIALHTTHFLIDEFQDTSLLQGSILEKIALPGKNILFIVGDPKQSIYRFRRADLSLFSSAAKKIEKNGGMIHSLNETFRLPPALTAVVNKVFAPLFAQRDFPFAPMISSSPDKPGSLQLVIARDEGERDIDKARRREAKWIARKIASLNLDASGLNECALLFKTSRPMAIYREELLQAGIPCRLTRHRSLFEYQEILDFMNLAAYLVGNTGLIVQAGILRSSFFDFSENFIEHFIRANPPHFLAPYTAGLFESDEDREKWGRLTAALRRWEGLRDRIPPLDLCRTVADDLNLSAEILPLFEELLSMMGEWDENLSLPQFHQKLSRLSDSGEAEAPGDGEGDGSVRLMTIHSAKGLEFTRVFLPQLYATDKTDSKDVYFAPDFGLVMKEPENGESTGLKIRMIEGERFAALKEAEEREHREESKRLLYVAMTRAKEELYLFLKETKKKPDIKSKNWNDWLLALLPEERDQAVPLTDVPVCHSEPPKPCHPEPQAKDLPSTPGRSFAYAQDDKLKVKPIYTVSQFEAFSRCGKEYELRYVKGVPSTPRGDLPAQTWGTFIHEIFQFLDFSTLDNLETVVSQALVNEHLSDPDSQILAKVKKLLSEMMSSPRNQALLAHPEKSYAELPFYLDCGDFYLKGTLDRLIFSGGKWVILDFKTGRLSETLYAGQMMAYAAAVSGILNVSTLVTALLFTDNPALLEEEWDAPRLLEASTRLQKAHADILEKSKTLKWDFAYHRSICPSCPYFARNDCGVKNIS